MKKCFSTDVEGMCRVISDGKIGNALGGVLDVCLCSGRFTPVWLGELKIACLEGILERPVSAIKTQSALLEDCAACKGSG